MPAPWTQSITLDWRPELRFYERRYEILRILQERGDMWAFHVSEEAIQARLFDVDHQLTVRQHRTSLHILAPDADARGWDAVELAVATLHPSEMRYMSVAFQFLEPLVLDFDTAVRNAHGTVLGVPGTGAIVPNDWAVLLDLKLSRPVEASGQTEFGVLSAHEVPSRLRRTVGRISRAEAPTIADDQWNSDEFPPVSLFADITFRAAATAGEGALAAFRSFWDGARAEAGNLVTELKKQLAPDDNKEEVAS